MPAPSPAAATIVPAPSAAPGSPAIAAPDGDGSWLWYLAGAAAVLIAGLLFRRRSAAPRDRLDQEPQAIAEPQPVPAAEAESSPATPDPPAFKPAPQRPPLIMALEARHLSRALVNATLAYRLTLTNRSDRPLGPLRIAGDITSAHASVSAREQLALDGDGLPALHEVAALAPGQAVTLSGELRLPIASILPISSGGGRVFVPLARFRAESAEGLAATHVFVVGQAGERPGDALRPFPLDRGPGVDRGLGQRELELPA
jgi:hypothetical protein